MRKQSLSGWLAVLAIGAAVASAPTPAGAQVVEEQGPTPRPETWQAALGVRNSFVRSTGFDPFSGSDVLPQVSLTAEYVFFRQGAVALAAGTSVDYGRSDADARGASTSLDLWRLSLVTEGRYYPWHRAYAFARLAPGMLHGSALLTDASSPNGAPLEDGFDVLSVDTSAGAAVRVTGPATPVAAWITAEGGYGWAQSHHLQLAPQAAARDQAKLAPVDLGTIDPRGVFMRLAVVIAY